MTEQDVEYKRLYWHSRRGMLELDVLLLGYLEEAYHDAAPDDQDRYRRLLECEDNVLFSWLMRRTRPDDEDLQRIIDLILAHAQSKRR
ncbi:succinate dehydrogenase assembly factor 2 [Hydrocarboniclastica marina]|uniref:FAD assembly factor SdhE n=1 Tax=Hydrocarboniclastica marina TaxID=2259620 RepID=A0A4P7XHJ8_9ALTE|nr:succinate dehydrogenase assembly factor 2 [Hydrocarboniclastica marina]MAL99739.1 hypothetical protein [Alteromonadaceae bacterium]QCF25287.1 succinate dehydrogenase assembly factor 2 family protein [Hydrocarboniclastica marina]|tara:strand:+ start:2038 stop:2301 length:264 start_codon:yes stop_codon:yes gene_type:complete